MRPAGAVDNRRKLLRAALLGCLLSLLGASPARAAPAWLPASDLSLPGKDANNPGVAMDDAGDTVVVWERQNVANPSRNVQLSTRSPGGSFSSPVDLSLASTDPDVAMTPGGEAVAVWRHFAIPPGNYLIQASTRPPGGSFSAPVNVLEVPTAAIPSGIRVAVNAAGDTAVVWQRMDPGSELKPNPAFIEASVRPAGGSFSEPVRVSPPRGEPSPGETEEEEEKREEEEAKETASGARIAIDPAGNVIVVWEYFDGTDQVTQAATRPAGGSFSVPIPLSEGGEDAGSPDVAMDSAGNATAVWARSNGANTIVQASTRPPGGGFSIPPNDLSAAGADAFTPEIAITPSGAATAIWTLVDKDEFIAQSATRPPGGGFSSPEDVSAEGENALFPALAMNANGDAAVVWSGPSGPSEIVRASFRPAGGVFSAPVGVSTASSLGFFHAVVALDKAGDATAVWSRSNGANNIVQAAGYDAFVPELRDLSIPSSGTVGVPVTFSAGPFDVWPIGPPSFSFGDGGEAVGTAVSHVYSSPGSYRVMVTATDAAETATTAEGSIAIAPLNSFTIGKLKLNRKKGTGTLTVTVPEPGQLVLTGPGVKKATVSVATPGSVKLPLKAAGKGRRRLAEKGKLSIRLRIAYTPNGGSTNVQHKRVTLVKKLG